MRLEPIKILKQDYRGIIYRTETVNYIIRRKGTVSADHTHEEAETLYLIEGKGKLTIGGETQKIEAPIKVLIPANEYHKLVAITDIKLIRA